MIIFFLEKQYSYQKKKQNCFIVEQSKTCYLY